MRGSIYVNTDLLMLREGEKPEMAGREVCTHKHSELETKARRLRGQVGGWRGDW